MKVIEMESNIGIKSLIEISNISKPLKTNHLGYNLGPKINAGGRLGFSMLGVELLIEENQNNAIKIAKTLEKHIEKDHQETSVNEISDKKSKKFKCKHCSKKFKTEDADKFHKRY